MNRRMTLNEAADLIQRYLDDKSLYRQEWNDFVDTGQKLPETEKLRVICDVDFQVLLEYQGEIAAQT